MTNQNMNTIWLLLAVGLIMFVVYLFRKRFGVSKQTYNNPASGQPPVGNQPTNPNQQPSKEGWWKRNRMMMIPWVLLTAVLGGGVLLGGFKLSPITLIGMVAVGTLLIVVYFGVEKHSRVDGNGPMYFVTVVTILICVSTLVCGVYYVATWYLFQESAELVRDINRTNWANQFRPTLVPNDGSTSPGANWDWFSPSYLIMGTGLILILIFVFKQEKKTATTKGH